MDDIASLLIYVKLTERSNLQISPPEQVCTKPSDAATAGNIFGTPVVKQLSVISHFYFGRLYFWIEPEVIQSQVRGIGWVLHFSNQFFGQKLLDSQQSWDHLCQNFLHAHCHLEFVCFFVRNLVAKPYL
jgi:hypothetical protein